MQASIPGEVTRENIRGGNKICILGHKSRVTQKANWLYRVITLFRQS